MLHHTKVPNPVKVVIRKGNRTNISEFNFIDVLLSDRELQRSLRYVHRDKSPAFLLVVERIRC